MRRLTDLYAWLLLFIFGGIVLHAFVSVILSAAWPHYSLWFKSWKELILLMASVLGAIIVTRKKLWSELVNDWVIRLTIIYSALHLAIVAVAPHGISATLAGLAIDLRYVLYFCLVYVLMKISPEWRRPFLIVGGVGATIVVIFAAIETQLPRDFLANFGYSKNTIVPYLLVDQNPHFVRYNSTLRGPNPLGAYTVIVLAMLTGLIVKKKVELKRWSIIAAISVVAICSVVALWVSYSRSALIAGILAVVLVASIASYKKSWLTKRNLLLLSAAIAICTVGLVVIARTSFVSNILLHVNPHGGGAINSNMAHEYSLATGIQQFVHQPLGDGIGSTGSASLFYSKGLVIEDQYLFVAHETGWLGLAVFILLLVLIMIRLWQKRQDWLSLAVFSSGVGLILIGFLLPVFADDTVGIVWWGLAGIALGTSSTIKAHGRHKSSHKKATRNA